MPKLINKKLGGATRNVGQRLWDMIKDNPNNEYELIGTSEEIEIPDDIKDFKPKKKGVAESKPMSMAELRKALKELKVDIPRFSKKVELIKLYHDNRKQRMGEDPSDQPGDVGSDESQRISEVI